MRQLEEESRLNPASQELSPQKKIHNSSASEPLSSTVHRDRDYITSQTGLALPNCIWFFDSPYTTGK